MSEGWIKLHRQIQDNPIWCAEPFTHGQAWVDLLLEANHDEGMFLVRGNKVVVPRGFIGKSEETLARKWKWSRGKVRRFLKHLETVQQIVQHKSSVLSLIEVKNYNLYQSSSTDNSTTDGTTERQQTVQQTDTNKKNKNVKNEKKETTGDLKAADGDEEILFESMLRMTEEKRLEIFNSLAESARIRFVSSEFQRMSKRHKTILNPKRKKSIQARLAEFGLEEIRKAWAEMAVHPFLRGQNDRGQDYFTLDYATRSDRIEFYLNQYSQKHGT